MKVESVKPYSSTGEKKQQIESMFDNIAGRYDFLNHFLSFGVDLYWRKKAIATLAKDRPKLILDIATGTADLALQSMKSLNPEKIIGVDISEEMLEIGRKKIKNKDLTSRIELLKADSEQLIFDDNKFDAVTVSFGVRNFQNLEKGLREMLRVLKPGGKLMILEFSQPRKFIRPFYKFYSSRVTPGIGKLIAKDKAAYSYLHESVSVFPSGGEFMAILEKVGYKNISCKPLTFGIATIYNGTK